MHHACITLCWTSSAAQCCLFSWAWAPLGLQLPCKGGIKHQGQGDATSSVLLPAWMYLMSPSSQVAALPSSASPCPGHPELCSHGRSLQDSDKDGVSWGSECQCSALAVPVAAQILDTW